MRGRKCTTRIGAWAGLRFKMSLTPSFSVPFLPTKRSWNTGEISRVVKKNNGLPLRPVVEVLVRRGKWLEEPVVIDLRESLLHHIEDLVAEEALL